MTLIRKTIALLIVLACVGLGARTGIDAMTAGSPIIDIAIQGATSILGIIIGVGFWRTDI
jgi:hypothetical protein